MISYGDVPLTSVTPGLAAHIEAALSLDELLLWETRTWPGPRRESWPWPGVSQAAWPGPVRPGTLTWPTGASRWAVGYFLATDAQLAAIRAALWGAPNSISTPGGSADVAAQKALPLVLTEEDALGEVVSSITADLWMLPPRPLWQIDEGAGLWLLLLVDDRYYWQSASTGDLVVTAGTTTWEGLYQSLGTALGIEIEVDEIPAAYGYPDASLTAHYESVAQLLDAVARSVGQRVVRSLDGTVQALNATSSQDTADLNYQNAPELLGGGALDFADSTPGDLALLLPGSVSVAFPVADSANTLTGDWTSQETPLSSLGASSPVLEGLLGNQGVKTFHTTFPARLLADNVTYDNVSAQEALAKQIALDWYAYQLGDLSVRWSGIVDWEPEGLHERITWTLRAGDCSTRVERPPYLDLVEELAQGDGKTPEDGCCTKGEIVEVTSATAQSGLYPAQLSTRNSDGSWTESGTVWFVDANGGSPTANTRYLVRLVGADTAGVPIYCGDAPAPASNATPLTVESGSDTITATGTLAIDPTTGLTLSGSSPLATLGLQAASDLLPGAVTCGTTQTFKGNKSIDGILYGSNTINVGVGLNNLIYGSFYYSNQAGGISWATSSDGSTGGVSLNWTQSSPGAEPVLTISSGNTSGPLGIGGCPSITLDGVALNLELAAGVGNSSSGYIDLNTTKLTSRGATGFTGTVTIPAGGGSISFMNGLCTG